MILTVSFIIMCVAAAVRTFPEETSIPEERYGYFFNDLSFNSSRLLTGAAYVNLEICINVEKLQHQVCLLKIIFKHGGCWWWFAHNDVVVDIHNTTQLLVTYIEGNK